MEATLTKDGQTKKIQFCEPTGPKQFYYVSIVDGPKYALLAGPYETHAEALHAVRDATRKAHDMNSTQAAFASFGTCGSDDLFKTIFGKL